MSDLKFFLCHRCGNLVYKVINGGGSLVCCGEKMEELVAKTADSSTEKHVPLIDIDGKKVKITVGSTLHPMLEAHYIQWIALETTNGGCQMRELKPGQEPVANFVLAEGEKVVAAYEYCNVHGLWKAEV